MTTVLVNAGLEVTFDAEGLTGRGLFIGRKPHWLARPRPRLVAIPHPWLYNTHNQGHYESLDHILVSQEFVHQNPRRLGEIEYVSILNNHLVDDTLSEDKMPVR